jgi:hypothetical protein
MTPEKILLDELSCWYHGDELLDVGGEEFAAEIPARAADSVANMAKAAGPGGLPEVIALLGALRDDRKHPLHEKIGDQTLIWWNDSDASWKAFQTLADAMIAGLREAAP